MVPAIQIEFAATTPKRSIYIADFMGSTGLNNVPTAFSVGRFLSTGLLPSNSWTLVGN
jgi:hypothetical protein